MFCANCGTENDDGVSFCSNCGKSTNGRTDYSVKTNDQVYAGGINMNLKVVGKIGFLLVFIGFFMPVACDQNGFELAKYFIEDNFIIGILMYLVFISAIVGVILGILLMQNKEVDKGFEWICLIVCMSSGLIVYFTQLEDGPKLQSGAYMILTGWIITLIFQIIPELNSTNLINQSSYSSDGVEGNYFNPIVKIKENVFKKCPFCAEEIKKDAIICRFCGKDIQKYEIELKNNQEEDLKKQKEEETKKEQEIMEKYKNITDIFCDEDIKKMSIDEKDKYANKLRTQFNETSDETEKKYFAKNLTALGYEYYRKFT